MLRRLVFIDLVREWRRLEDHFQAHTTVLFSTSMGLYVLLNTDEFVRGFTEHVMSYALGRKLKYHDKAVVDGIVKDLNQDGLRFSKLVTEIVLSEPFRKVRNDRLLSHR